jgi:prepilin-type processing-associated H-X9-DG protein
MKKDPFAAFTLIELVVVVAVAAVIGVTLAAATARTQPTGKAIQCLNNLRQFTAAWNMYSADSSERVANNYGVQQTVDAINFLRFDNWANNVMTWGASASVTDKSNTNYVWLTNSLLGIYLLNSPYVYKCPADNFLSAAQVTAGFKQRLRSTSMNSVFGLFSSGNSADPTWSGKNWAFPQYVQYLKRTSVPKPARTWLVLDEQPDSINDGYFINNPSLSSWQDIPGALHNGGCGFSFADGHSEIRKWRSTNSVYAVGYAYPLTRPFDALGRDDYAWYLEHTGYVNASNGQPQYNY